MIRLYLVRHCETLALTGDAPANPRGDAPLSPAGVEQARRLGELLREWPVDLVLTSLYLRAVQTAQGAMRDREPPVPVHASLALNELDRRCVTATICHPAARPHGTCTYDRRRRAAGSTRGCAEAPAR